MSDGSAVPPSASEAFLEFLELEEQGLGDFEAFCEEHASIAEELRRLNDARLLLSNLLGASAAGIMGPAGTLRLTMGGVDPDIRLEPEPEEADPATAALYETLSGRGPGHQRYRFKGEVDRGGMGAILRVWDEDLRRTVAMKVILERGRTGSGPTPSALGRTLTRFLEEAQITGQLDHPGVVPVHELGVDPDGRAYFTMKLVKGRSLHALAPLVNEERQGWNRARAVQLFVRICETMAFAHSKGVIHRDLKPSNVMVGDFGEVYVMDWGLARVRGHQEEQGVETVRHLREDEDAPAEGTPALTRAGEVLGTPAYMSPEQAVGDPDDLDERADVYSLGAMLYHLLADRMPYSTPGEHVPPRVILLRLAEGAPKPLRDVAHDVPVELAAICEKAMARRREERYGSMADLGEDLRCFLEQRVVRAYETGALAEFRKWVGRNRLVAASLAIGLALALTGLGSTVLVQARARLRLTEARDAAEASGYAAAIAAADGALRAHDVAQARRILSEVDPGERGWEWTLLAGRLDGSKETLFGHEGPIEVLAVTEDGSRAATWERNGAARLWDLRIGRETGRIPLPGTTRWPHQPAIDRRLERLAHPMPEAGEEGPELVLHDLTGTGSSERYPALDEGQHAVAFRKDGGALALGAGTLVVVERGTGTVLWRSEPLEEERRFTTVVFSEDGARLAARDSSSYLHAWDLVAGTPLFRATRTPKVIGAALSFRPDGRQIAFGSDHNTVVLWDVDSASAVQVLSGHVERPRSVHWHPDGVRLLTGAFDQTIRVWDRRSGTQLHTLRGHQGPASALFLPDGEGILSASFDKTLKRWDPGERRVGTPRQEKTGMFLLLAARTGTRVAAMDFDGQLTVLDPRDGERLLRLDSRGAAYRALDLSRDGRFLACTAAAHDVEIWDVEEGRLLRTLGGHTAAVHDVAFAPDGARLASASSDGKVLLWDLEEVGGVQALEHPVPVRCVRWSEAGGQLVTGADDGIIRRFDGEGRSLGELPGTGRPVWDVVPLAGGTRFAALSWPGNYYYDLDLFDDQGARMRLARVPSWNRTRLVPTPDGQRFFLSKIRGPGIPVYDASSGQELLVLRGDLRGGLGLNHGLMGFVGDAAGELWAYDQKGLLVVFDVRPGREVARVLDAAAEAEAVLEPLWRREAVRGPVLDAVVVMEDLDPAVRRAALDSLRDSPRGIGLVLDELTHPVCDRGAGRARWEEVHDALERIDAWSEHEGVDQLLAWSLVRMGRYGEARSALAALREENPFLASVTACFQALVELGEGHESEALECLEEARRLRSGGGREAYYPHAGTMIREVEIRLGR